MDVFMEYMVKKKKEGKDIAIVSVIIFFASLITIAGLLAIMAFSAQGISFAFSLGLVLLAFIWYGVYVLIGMFNIEYEYILTNNELDIDKIMSKKGRKRMVTFDFSEAEIMANIEDNEHNHSYKNNTQIKVKDFTGDKGRGNVYFVDVPYEGEKIRVLFQPTSKMLAEIKKFNPRTVFVYDSI